MHRIDKMPHLARACARIGPQILEAVSNSWGGRLADGTTLREPTSLKSRPTSFGR